MPISRSELTAPSATIATSNNAYLFNQALSSQNMAKRSLTPTDRSSSPAAQRQRHLNPEITSAVESYASAGAEAMQRARNYNLDSINNLDQGHFQQGYWDLDYAQDNALSAALSYKNAFILSGNDHHFEKASEALEYSGEILFEKHISFLNNSKKLQGILNRNTTALNHVPVSARQEILIGKKKADESKEIMLKKMDFSHDNSLSVQGLMSSVLETASLYESAGKQFATNYALYGHNIDYAYATHMFNESEAIYYEMHNAYPALMDSQRRERTTQGQ